MRQAAGFCTIDTDYILSGKPIQKAYILFRAAIIGYKAGIAAEARTGIGNLIHSVIFSIYRLHEPGLLRKASGKHWLVVLLLLCSQ
jgi:hypothetical protein